MIDQGEVDWKIVAIRAADPMAAVVNCACVCAQGWVLGAGCWVLGAGCV
jgi:hypothetical protein